MTLKSLMLTGPSRDLPPCLEALGSWHEVRPCCVCVRALDMVGSPSFAQIPCVTKVLSEEVGARSLDKLCEIVLGSRCPCFIHIIRK